MSDYNCRQYDLMIDRLDKFKQGRLPLSQLVSDLYGLMDVIENPNDEWKQTFLTEWGKLEDIYATMIFRKQTEISDYDSHTLVKACENLERLISEAEA